MLNTFKKYCHFGNLSDQFIVIFQTAVDMWPMHGTYVTELRRVVAMIEIVLSVYTFGLWEWSDQWRISSLITSSFPKYPLTLKLPPVKLRFSFDQFELLFTWVAAQEYQARYFWSTLLRIYMLQIFSDLPIKFNVTDHIDLELNVSVIEHVMFVYNWWKLIEKVFPLHPILLIIQCKIEKVPRDIRRA